MLQRGSHCGIQPRLWGHACAAAAFPAGQSEHHHHICGHHRRAGSQACHTHQYQGGVHRSHVQPHPQDRPAARAGCCGSWRRRTAHGGQHVHPLHHHPNPLWRRCGGALPHQVHLRRIGHHCRRGVRLPSLHQLLDGAPRWLADADGTNDGPAHCGTAGAASAPPGPAHGGAFPASSGHGRTAVENGGTGHLSRPALAPPARPAHAAVQQGLGPGWSAGHRRGQQGGRP
mmetsp:Transcript_11661/g.20685  ORF Transcript_11661/g.20685 Transcript_11661/m.20685 type:complete len:229 (-) Transcript_11661:2029-2715(-)